MAISPESFNRIREANAQYGAAREALGIVRAVAESIPAEANVKRVEAAELEAKRALEGFNRALGAADLQTNVVGK